MKLLKSGNETDAHSTRNSKILKQNADLERESARQDTGEKLPRERKCYFLAFDFLTLANVANAR